MKNKIYVTKTFLPPFKEYAKHLKKIWRSNHLTNQGPLLQEFEKKCRKYLRVKNFHFVTNGTIALQVALRALDITEGEVITTPFTYVATTSAILWERCQPVYVDIDPKTLCIDANKIEEAITKKTRAILAVHVFGFPCNIEAIEKIAKKYNLKVIYDAAHCFGVKYGGKSIYEYGDISIGSFHATKVFHTIEGGCLVCRDEKINKRIELVKRFGHEGDQHFTLGLNAKASEFQAAMGLVNLDYVDDIIMKRKLLCETYDKFLNNGYKRHVPKNKFVYNYAYYPIIFNSENNTIEAIKKLNRFGIYPRRYFYPSLNTLVYHKKKYFCAVSESVAKRILCLPLYNDLKINNVKKICRIINEKKKIA
ncbi:MAG: DegT/DnrJ/EryC1/StrS family aminotransferase [Patescibacteria group bacterium]